MKKSITLVFGLVVFLSYSAIGQGWKWAAGSSSSPVNCEGFAVAADKNGNSYGVGTVIAFGPSLPPVIQTFFGPYTIIDSGAYMYQGVIVSLDSTGHYRWALGTQNGNVLFLKVKTDDSGNVYVLANEQTLGGFSIGGFHTTDFGTFMIKINHMGTITWVRQIPYGTHDFCVSHSGSFFLAGGNVSYAKYDRDMNLVWTNNLTSDSALLFSSINISADSQIYITGTFNSGNFTIGSTTLHNTPGKPAVFLAKFDPSGNALWARSPKSDSTLNVIGVAVDPANNAYITGSYYGALKFASDSLNVPPLGSLTYTFKYDAAGNPQWARSVREIGFYAPSDIVTDKCGNIWIVGNMPYDSLSDPMFLIHFDTLGHILDTIVMNSGGDDEIGLAVDQKGNLFVCGDYYNHAIFGGTTLPNDSLDETLFVAKYRYGFPDCTRDTIPFVSNNGVELAEVKSGQVTMFPNPSSSIFTITGETEYLDNANAELFDLNGRIIYRYRMLHDKAEINVGDISPGLYQLRIVSKTGIPTMIKVVVIK